MTYIQKTLKMPPKTIKKKKKSQENWTHRLEKTGYRWGLKSWVKWMKGVKTGYKLSVNKSWGCNDSMVTKYCITSFKVLRDLNSSHHKKTFGNYLWWGMLTMLINHFTMYTNIKWCCTPETNVVVNYTSIKKKKKPKNVWKITQEGEIISDIWR